MTNQVIPEAADNGSITITEFLEARVGEDEAVARECLTHQPEGPWMDSLHDLTFDYDHFARWNPDRVLAECAAKRALMTVADDAENYGDHVMILFAIAAVYSDHPDYQQEWAK